MPAYEDLSREELQQLLAASEDRYKKLQAEGLALDMTRGKPCPEQLDLSLEMLSLVTPEDYKSANGTDTRNYGGLDGLPEAKELMADFMEVGKDEVIIGGNSSLSLMHDTIVHALIHGVPGSETPWGKLPVKFLCPAPGYDRHFAICQHKGIEMITVACNEDGPDMDEVEKLLAEDDTIKGIWCVPKYGNPLGNTYSDEVVDRLAKMTTKAPDFRIFWDNAYTVHHLGEEKDSLKNLLEACKAAGNPDRVFMFGSTSKISFAGSGLSVLAASQANLDWMRSHLSIQTIGPDKLNQLRHVRFFKNMAGIEAHMQKHAAIIKPKFEVVLDILESELAALDFASWSNPKGGYFISLDTLENCAKDVVVMASAAGVKMTGAGATFPYKKDPKNNNIRIAPTLPSLEEIKKAMEVVAVCVKIVSAKKLLG
ncbi:aminotransferase class I/II-fold pyridoxal phosphate-dependent enzyme [Flammeovirgaceae bacterium SG7u.111]|nr:aminotransferase class I/II-fold pyridoxal phosphate-dependent enzyme [Flammeovirgaceae bacterium SG7u.132]WPO37382.1 aminotransferase class I/II-fold pyridoxal phosphate-dependent enzyme [Flammeovirgaceae bacterium SG7u.111]